MGAERKILFILYLVNLCVTWPCGDIEISSENTCHCGAAQLEERDWSIGYGSVDNVNKFCCPSSSPSLCIMTPDGDGHCNGTVKNGTWL